MTLATRTTGILVLAALAMSATAAGAFSLRAPQIVFAYGPLQGYLTANDGGINVATDQLDAQAFSTGVTGNTDFTLTLKNAAGASLGVYNTLAGPSPTLYQLFPSAAAADWSVTCHFTASGLLQVALYDNNFTYLGTTTYTGVDRTHFGFYISSPGGLWYSQDGRNGPRPQILTYAGTGINYGDWWECFEDLAYNSGSSHFTGAVVLLQSVSPVPAHTNSWGALKATYR